MRAAGAHIPVTERQPARVRPTTRIYRSSVLKPNMVTPGLGRLDEASSDEVADSTVATLRRIVPPEVAGIAFLSGGQPAEIATRNLAAIATRQAPWPLTERVRATSGVLGNAVKRLERRESAGSLRPIRGTARLTPASASFS